MSSRHRRPESFLDIVLRERDWLESVEIPDLLDRLIRYRDAMRVADPCGYCGGSGRDADPEVGRCDICQGDGHGRRFFQTPEDVTTVVVPDDGIPF